MIHVSFDARDTARRILERIGHSKGVGEGEATVQAIAELIEGSRHRAAAQERMRISSTIESETR